MEVTFEKLLQTIGALYVELDALRTDVQRLRRELDDKNKRIEALEQPQPLRQHQPV